ncbi:WG repeat-containing protein [Leptospira weilii]|uniref:WG repeat-containing protein n=1 Tax=Leptospira weilii TaxID=28184 RepID=UPI0020235A4F|nr:WG repeat-containing protein [Leptospira weilii]MCL8265197.1 WG repeat-containing protein [Leptospira weilii]
MTIKTQFSWRTALLTYFIFFACISVIVAHPCSTEFKIDTIEKDGVSSIRLTPTNPNVSVIQPQFDRVGEFSNGLAPVLIGNKWGYIDYTGTLVIQLQFEDAHSFSEGLAFVRIKNQWGYIDPTGKIVIQPRFDEAKDYLESGASNFSEGFASVKIGNKWGYIDRTGKIVIQPKFDGADSFSEGFAAVEVREKWGFIDPTGTFVIQPQFVSARKFSEGLASVGIEIDKSGGFKYGFIDTTGEIAIQPNFHSLGTFRKGLAYVWDGLRMVHIDRVGNIYRLTFEERFRKQFHLTCNSDKCGAFFGLKTIFPAQFDYAKFASEGFVSVKIENKWGYIDFTKCSLSL